jgi:hypothetical protein
MDGGGTLWAFGFDQSADEIFGNGFDG